VVRTALAVTAAMLLARLWFLAHRALDLDEYEHAHAAWSVAQGLLPYRDFFEHHPPLFYLLCAPLFAVRDIATDPSAAVRALMRARGAMWLTTVLSMAIVYRLGTRSHDWRSVPATVGAGALRPQSDHVAAAFAVLLLATSSQFLESMLEFRPDVPAVLCLLASIWCLAAGGERDDPTRSRARLVVAGLAFGAALLFTQKAIFAAPGLGAALLSRRRVAPVAWFATGALLPVAAIAWWFNRHDALAPLWYYTVPFNGTLNADRFSPFPRLLSNVVQQPAIYGLGIIGITVPPVFPSVGSGFSRTAIGFTALSLIAGIFVIGKAYDQYYALLLPLLAVAGGAAAAAWLEGVNGRKPSIAAAAAVALAALALAISLRAFNPIDRQLDEIAFITAQTSPSDTYLGGSPGAALFRPHGWYYFFLTGPFASDADYADLLSSLETGRIRPRLVVRDRYLDLRAPAPLLAYIAAHYRRARGEVYLRQSEYGSASLNTSEASDRLDRPFTR
jgi:dolichyl-phosphate-mannose-protein mannosyltransferase